MSKTTAYEDVYDDVMVSIADGDSPVEKSINVEVPPEVVDRLVERELRKLTPKLRVKGFRKGRAPISIVSKLHGERVKADVVKDLVADVVCKTIEENSLNVIGELRVDAVGGDDDADYCRCVKVGISLYPEPKLEGCLGLDLEVEKTVFSEDITDYRVEDFLFDCSEVVEVESRDVLEKGDLALVSRTATVDGKRVEILCEEGVQIEVGEDDEELPGFIPALVGMKRGETRPVLVDLPVDYCDEELAGKTVEFEVTLGSINTRVIPELTDELVRKMKVAESVEGLRKIFRESAIKGIERANRVRLEDGLIRAIISCNPFDVPQTMIDDRIRVLLMDMGVRIPRKADWRNVDVSKFRESMGEMAEFQTKRAIILDILEKEFEIEVSDNDVEKWLDEESNGDDDMRSDIARYFRWPKDKGIVKEVIAHKRVYDRLADAANIEEKEVSIMDASGKPLSKRVRGR